MATVVKLKSGQWRARGYYKDPVTGKVSRPSFTADTRYQAVLACAEWEANKERAKQPQNLTVKECIERYITVKEATLSPATIRGYRIMQRNNYGQVEPILLKNLTDEDMQGFISDMCKNHSPKTVRNAYALLVASVSMFSPRQYRVTLPQKKPADLHIPTDAQVKQLLDAADHDLKIAVALAAIGTCRAGEVCALKYADVSKTDVHVHSDMIRDSKNKWIIKDIPKTSSSDRYIPLPPKVIKMIGKGEPDQFIYGKSPSALEHSFDRLRKKVGIDCRFHDLRHYAISIMHALGIPDQYIQERSGHKTAAVLRNIYRHALSDQSKKFAQKANTHFSSLL